jgi:hypothetical protein
MRVTSTGYLLVVILLGLHVEIVHEDGIFSYEDKSKHGSEFTSILLIFYIDI